MLHTDFNRNRKPAFTLTMALFSLILTTADMDSVPVSASTGECNGGGSVSAPGFGSRITAPKSLADKSPSEAQD